ncbi:lantibiotic dehydratase C-terminal domain-containing protein [Kitasatospora cineracea]|uniref:lantibiotic dehydratase C-terminal domain-containing protein n=1 Tax=Kitasatospora cineracea TaxID=88074 RepID=UPI0036DAC137
MPATTGPVTRQYLLRLAATAPEAFAVKHLGPALARLEASQAIGAWYFERGADTWALVCESTTRPGFANEDPEREVLDLCCAVGMIDSWTATAYLPPTYSAGGTAGLPAARRWRHRDSRHVLAYLRAVRVDHLDDQRDELFVIHAAAAMAAAGLDRQGVADAWSRIADTAPGGQWPTVSDDLVHTVGTLLAASGPDSGPRHRAAWSEVHADYGRAVADLHQQGQLWLGRRTVLAAQLLSHADRLGVTDPARLAAAAATAALGLAARTEAIR